METIVVVLRRPQASKRDSREGAAGDCTGSESSGKTTPSPPTPRDALPGAPPPSSSPAPAAPVGTWLCLSSLHPLNEWSLQFSRGGSPQCRRDRGLCPQPSSKPQWLASD